MNSYQDIRGKIVFNFFFFGVGWLIVFYAMPELLLFEGLVIIYSDGSKIMI